MNVPLVHGGDEVGEAPPVWWMIPAGVLEMRLPVGRIVVLVG